MLEIDSGQRSNSGLRPCLEQGTGTRLMNTSRYRDTVLGGITRESRVVGVTSPSHESVPDVPPIVRAEGGKREKSAHRFVRFGVAVDTTNQKPDAPSELRLVRHPAFHRRASRRGRAVAAHPAGRTRHRAARTATTTRFGKVPTPLLFFFLTTGIKC